MQYKAIRASYGFRKRYWAEGDVFDSTEGEVIPHHFIPVFEIQNKEKPKDDPMAPKPASLLEPTRFNKGFMAQFNKEEVKIPYAPPKRGRKPKK